MPRQGQMVPGSNALDYEVVYYEGSDTLKTGYVLCYNYDSGTAATATKDRYSRAEKASSGNIHHFAGVVAEGLPSAGKTGPCLIRIVKPTSVSCIGYTDQNCTLGTTLLYVQSGSYYLTDGVYTSGTACSRPVALALQTIDRSSTVGTVQVRLDDKVVPFGGAGLTTGQFDVASSGVTSGTNLGSSLSLASAQAGGTFVGSRQRFEITGADAGFGDGVAGGGAMQVMAVLNNLTSANSNAFSANLIFKTLATNTGVKYTAASFKIENIDSTPAALATADIYAAEFVTQMNEDPGDIYMMHFRNDGTTTPTGWFKATDAAAVGFVTATNVTIDHALTCNIAGTTYYIGLYDAQTGS